MNVMQNHRLVHAMTDVQICKNYIKVKCKDGDNIQEILLAKWEKKLKCWLLLVNLIMFGFSLLVQKWQMHRFQLKNSIYTKAVFPEISLADNMKKVKHISLDYTSDGRIFSMNT